MRFYSDDGVFFGIKTRGPLKSLDSYCVFLYLVGLAFKVSFANVGQETDQVRSSAQNPRGEYLFELRPFCSVLDDLQHATGGYSNRCKSFKVILTPLTFRDSFLHE